MMPPIISDMTRGCRILDSGQLRARQKKVMMVAYHLVVSSAKWDTDTVLRLEDAVWQVKRRRERTWTMKRMMGFFIS